MKPFFTIILSIFLMVVLNGQADPELTAPGVSPSPGISGEGTEIRITLQNESPTRVPYNALNPTQIVITLNKIQPDFNSGNLVYSVTNGPSWFIWDAECAVNCGTPTAVWIITGTQNQEISGIIDPLSPAPSQTYTFPGTVTANSSEADARSFNGHGFNANIIPCAYHSDCDAERGPESNNQSIYTYTQPVLPVTLLTFEVKKEESKALLNWITAEEFNNDYFEIEHSSDASNWTTLGRVDGHGTLTTPTHYQFTHTNPLENANYYRLKQFDLNGDYAYSDIKMLIFYQDGGQANYKIHPNPTSDRLYVTNIQRDISDNNRLHLIDNLGRSVIEMDLSKTDNVSIAELENGIYYVKIIDQYGRMVWEQKIIKL